MRRVGIGAKKASTAEEALAKATARIEELEKEVAELKNVTTEKKATDKKAAAGKEE